MSETRKLVPRKVENLDDLFLLNTPMPEEGEVSSKATATLKISQLVPFDNHPFKLYEGERLNDLVESIKDIGVILPVIVRPKGNDIYQLLSGHNRANAAKLAGLTEVPAIIKEDLSDDDALLIVTETNLIQRSFADLTHSERAKALSEHHKALASQGKRTDMLNEIRQLSNSDEIRENPTFSPVAKKLRTHEDIGQKYKLSKDTIARYLRINKLIHPFKDKLDLDFISIRTAYDLSFFDEETQAIVYKVWTEHNFKLDMKASEMLRNFYNSDKLTEETVYQILSGELSKRTRAKAPPPYKLKNRVYSKYFNPLYKALEIEEIIDLALADFFDKYPERRKGESNEER